MGCCDGLVVQSRAEQRFGGQPDAPGVACVRQVGRAAPCGGRADGIALPAEDVAMSQQDELLARLVRAQERKGALRDRRRDVKVLDRRIDGVGEHPRGPIRIELGDRVCTGGQ